MIRILVTGAHSQLARALAATQSGFVNMQVAFEPKSQLDITDLKQLRAYLVQHPIDYLINCAAYTQVDQAEQEKEQADAVNVVGATYLAELAQEMQFSLWHISTDYVFDGKVAYPYSEEMHTHPLNYYGTSKLAGEQQVLTKNAQAYVIRTAWLYRATGNNFLTRFLDKAQRQQSITMTYDQVGCPTYADDLAQAIWQMIQQHYQAPDRYRPGIYHYAHEGLASRYDWAWAILQYTGLKCNLEPILSNAWTNLSQRPSYSVLNKEKVKNTFGLQIPHWQDGLLRCIQKLNKRL